MTLTEALQKSQDRPIPGDPLEGRLCSNECWLASAVLALYGASFFLPAVQVPCVMCGTGPVSLRGSQCFVLGLSGVPRGDLLGLAWLANPLVLVGVFLLLAGRRAAALVVGLFAVAAGVCAAHLDVPEPWRLREGFYLWVGSMGLLAAGSAALGWRLGQPGRLFQPRP
jgi:hypothetical protein